MDKELLRDATWNDVDDENKEIVDGAERPRELARQRAERAVNHGCSAALYTGPRRVDGVGRAA